MSYPTLIDVCNRLIEKARSSRGSTRETYANIAHKLRLCLNTFGNAAVSREDVRWEDLDELNWAVCTAGCSLRDQGLLGGVHLAKYLTHGQFNNLISDDVRRLILLEEPTELVPAERTRKNRLFLDYFRRGRFIGVSTVFTPQTLDIDSDVIQNCATKIALGGASDVATARKFTASVGLTLGQQEALPYMRRPGLAVVSDRRAMKPFSVQLFKPPENQHEYTHEQVDAISRRSESRLLERSSSRHDGSSTRTDFAREPKSHLVGSSSTQIGSTTESQPNRSRTGPTQKRRGRNALNIMRTQLRLDAAPYVFRNEAVHAAGITGGSTIVSAEAEAVKNGWIRVHRIPFKKTHKVAWEILAEGYAALGIPAAVEFQGGGEYEHRLVQHRLVHQLTSEGVSASIERSYPANGKRVDVSIQTHAGTVFHEVMASEPISKEVSNYELDCAAGVTSLREIVFVVSNRKWKRPLIEALRERATASGLSVPFRVELAGDIIRPLEAK